MYCAAMKTDSLGNKCVNSATGHKAFQNMSVPVRQRAKLVRKVAQSQLLLDFKIDALFPVALLFRSCIISSTVLQKEWTKREIPAVLH